MWTLGFRWHLLSVLTTVVRGLSTFYEVVFRSCTIEVVCEFTCMAKRQRQIGHIFHLIDKNVRIWSIANDIEVLNAQDFHAPNFFDIETFWWLVFLSFRVSSLGHWPNIYIYIYKILNYLDYFPPKLAYGNQHNPKPKP